MPSKKIIFAFTGQMASGKGTACAFFIKKYGAKTFKFSTMLRDVLDRLYVPQIRENIQDLSTILRGRFGQDLMAKVIAHDVDQAEASMIVVDGARRPEDVEYLRKLDNFYLVAIAADPKVRYERIKKRRENPDDASKTWEQFVKEGQAEAEVLIPQLMKEADVAIDNNGNQAELLKQLQDMYAKLTQR